MTNVKLDIPPGIFKDDTEYALGPRWTDGNNVRFHKGRPKKIGGWSKDNTLSFTGVPRSIRAWRLLNGMDVYSVGTSSKLYVVYGGTKYDVTPIDRTTATMATDPFATTNTSTTVVVTETSHGTQIDDYVIFSGASTVNGLDMNAEFKVTAVNSVNEYEVEHTSAATGTGSGGGASVQADYLVPSGSSNTTPGLGWGAGRWSNPRDSSGGWGDPSAAADSGVFLDLAIWSIDLWGEDMVATKRGYKTYLWDATSPSSRATLITNAPATAQRTVVSMPDRHLVAVAAHNGSSNDPMNVAWSDQEDYTTWTPAAANTAGSQRLQVGTKILGAVPSRQQILLFTDEALYGMRYQGPPYTFGFNLMGTNCGLMGPHAALDYEGTTYWMGCQNFYIFTGQVRLLPCSVRRYVFDDFNSGQSDKCFAALNKQWQEIWWFYPSANSNEPDRYVALNYVTGDWFIGQISRTAWVDRQGQFDYPTALDSSGYIYSHEYGVDADTAALDAYVESGMMEVSTPEAPAGEQLGLVDKVIPDADITGELDVTIKVRKYPNDTAVSKGPFAMTSSTKKVSVRAKGREIQIKLESDGLGETWQAGSFRLNVIPVGGR